MQVYWHPLYYHNCIFYGSDTLRTAIERPIGVPNRIHLRNKQLTLGVLKQFRLIYGSVRQHFRQIEEKCGISGSQLWMLHEMQDAPGIGVSELALRLSIHQTTCSQLVEKLVARGYVVKTRSEEDQRRVGLAVTKRAAKVLTDAPGPAEGLIPEALLGLSEATLQSLATNLGQLIDGLHLQDEQAAERPLAEL
jgi:DNA-binding MarR family transcriptional regulator